MSHNSTSNYKVSIKAILLVYAIIFISLLIITSDIFFFNYAIRTFLPVNPYDIFLNALIFELPHILASFFAYADKDYLKFYKKHLMYYLPLVLLAFTAISLFSYKLAILLYFLYTFKHVISQQTGIGYALMKVRPKFSSIWTWSLTGQFWIFVVFVAYGFYGGFRNSAGLYIETIFFILTGIFLALTAWYFFLSKTKVGKLYILLICTMVVVNIMLFYLGYIFFVVLIPRFIHDVTAFIFYITHDRNRFKETHSNYIYRALEKIKVPIIIILPLTAILLSQLIVVTFVIMLLAITHYYLETFSWRRESIHRKYLSFW